GGDLVSGWGGLGRGGDGLSAQEIARCLRRGGNAGLGSAYGRVSVDGVSGDREGSGNGSLGGWTLCLRQVHLTSGWTRHECIALSSSGLTRGPAMLPSGRKGYLTSP